MMKQFILLFCVIFLNQLSAQKIHTSIKGGLNASLSTAEAYNVNNRLALGYIIGLNGRINLKKPDNPIFENNRRKSNLFLESGINLVNQGTSYRYNRQLGNRHNLFQLEIPILLVFRMDNQYFEEMNEGGWFPIVKGGFAFSYQQTLGAENLSKEKDEVVLEATQNIYNYLEPGFTVAVGAQKEYGDGSILYYGISWMLNPEIIMDGSFGFEDNNETYRGNYISYGDYIALEAQYFFGNKATQQTIFNPRLIF